MRISKFNAEGYYDPTAYAALKNLRERQPSRPQRIMLHGTEHKKLVYVCSPFAGDTQANVQNARRFSRYVVMKKCLPITPHLLFPQFMREPEERESALRMGLILLQRCAELWVFGDVISSGMATEIAYAAQEGKRIRYFTADCEEVRHR